MSGRIIVSDVLAQRQQEMHSEGGKIILNTTLDVQDVVDRAKAHRDHLWTGTFKGTPGELHQTLAAVIPLTFWFKLRNEGILQDKDAFQRWLNANPAFKATDGNALSMVPR